MSAPKPSGLFFSDAFGFKALGMRTRGIDTVQPNRNAWNNGMVESRFAEHVRQRLPSTGSLSGYAIAMALVAIGVLLRFPLDELAGGQPLPPYLTLYPMIVLSAFVGGMRVGFAAMIASALTAWLLWVGPAAGPLTPLRVATAIIFLFTGTATVLVCGFARMLLDEVARLEQSRAVTAHESVHRIKNLLAVIQSISRKISSETTDVMSYRDMLDARLNALAIAQDILLKRDWGEVQLNDLVRATLGPFLANPRLDVKPMPEVLVPKSAVTTLSMALYELATNSAKYGALASPTGYVKLDAHLHGGRCALEWREIGLAQVAMGNSAGLGATLIRNALTGVGDATVLYDLSPQSVACVFEWPVTAPSADGGQTTSGAARHEKQS
jgi:two-component sensor histidine kinase